MTNCISWPPYSGNGSGHSHPFFNTATEYHAGNGCHGDTTSNPSPSQLASLNSDKNNFQGGDFDFAAAKGPLYLIAPTGLQMKRLNITTSTTVYP